LAFCTAWWNASRAALASGSEAPPPQLALEAMTMRRFGSMKMPWPKMPRAAKLPSL
jgi:hypothetical protein